MGVKCLLVSGAMIGVIIIGEGCPWTFGNVAIVVVRTEVF